MKEDQVWSQVQEELRFQLAKRTYDMWLKNTSVQYPRVLTNVPLCRITGSKFT